MIGRAAWGAAVCLVPLGACDGGAAIAPDAQVGEEPGEDAGRRLDAGPPTGGRARPDLPYALSVESFNPGAHAGFNADELPDVVLGPPKSDAGGGSLDVVSLGVGGEIVLGFGPRAIIDGPGADLIVFENAFYVAGELDEVFAEAGEVAVSEDGAHWVTFPCDAPDTGHAPGPGCAGGTPTRPFDPDKVVPLVLAQTGGDGFDLAEVGLTRARFVRIRDRANTGEGTSAGFDLDAVGIVHEGAVEASPTDDDDAGVEP